MSCQLETFYRCTTSFFVCDAEVSVLTHVLSTVLYLLQDSSYCCKAIGSVATFLDDSVLLAEGRKLRWIAIGSRSLVRCN